MSEISLDGGYTNAGLVVRVGDTVRRPSSSPATHALLRHLEAVGFDGAPRLLGVDERGREVLSFVPGRAAMLRYGPSALTPPEPWAPTDESLVSVPQLLRRSHAAAPSSDHSPLDWPVALPTAYRG